MIYNKVRRVASENSFQSPGQIKVLFEQNKKGRPSSTMFIEIFLKNKIFIDIDKKLTSTDADAHF